MSRMLLVSALLLALVDAFAEGAPVKNCQLSQYKSISPPDNQAFKDFRDKYNEMLRDPAADCSARIFHRKLDKLSECQNLLALEKKVDVTIRVIQNLSDPELVRNASKPLEILASIQEDLRSCIQLKGLGGNATAQQPVLAKWLQKAYAGKSEGSARCLEEALIFNIFRLLNDLQNVAHKFNKSCH